MTTNTDFDYSNIDGALTPEQAYAALAAEQGDTNAAAAAEETGSAPATAAAEDDKATDGGDSKGSTAGAAATEPEIDPAKAVVLAKDGIHTIPYSKLEEARKGEQHWKAQAEELAAREAAARQQLAELQAQAQQRADNGQQATATDVMAAQAQAAIDAGVDVSLFGDFSEEALANGIAKLGAQMREQIRAELKAELAQELKPIKDARAKTEAQAHIEAIYSKYPNANEIAESNEFAAWVNSHPSAVRSAYWALLEPETGGTAQEIVELLDAFTAATQPKPGNSAASAAKTAIAQAQADPPTSLSNIPGGHVAGASPLDATAGLSGIELLKATEKMTPQQLDAWLDRQI